MSEHGKKMVAPIIISALIILYLVVYFGFIIYLIPFLWLKALVLIIPVALGGVMIGVLIQRIKEIQGGEEDDLSKY